MLTLLLVAASFGASNLLASAAIGLAGVNHTRTGLSPAGLTQLSRHTMLGL